MVFLEAASTSDELLDGPVLPQLLQLLRSRNMNASNLQERPRYVWTMAETSPIDGISWNVVELHLIFLLKQLGHACSTL